MDQQRFRQSVSGNHNGELGNRQEDNGQSESHKRPRKALWGSIAILLILILLLGWSQLGTSRRSYGGVKSIGTTLSPEGDLSYVDANGQSHKVRLMPLLDMAKATNSSPATTVYTLQGTKLVVATTPTNNSAQTTTASVDLSSLIPQTAPTSQANSGLANPRLSLSGANLTIAGGNTVNLNSLLYPSTASMLTGSNGVVVTHAAQNGGIDVSIATADGSKSGLLSAIDWTMFNAKENALSFVGNGLFSRSGNTVSSPTCAATQTLVFNGVAWVCSTTSPSGVGSVSGSGAVTSTGGSAPVVGLTTSSNLSQAGSVLDLSASGATAGTYGSSTSSASAIPVVTIDAKGRVTGISSAAIATASSSATGLLSSTDYAAFAAKQNALPAGTALQYLRGDQSLATLNTTAVPEGINLYYTSARFNGDFALRSTDNLSEGSTNLYFTNTRADARVNAQKGVTNGVASLDATGKVPNSQLPAIAITNTYVVASQAAMLALSANQGDIAVRTDVNKTFVLQTGPPTTLSNWIELATPGSPVTSVNGQTGTVSLLTTDISEGVNLYYTNARSRAALSASGPLSYNSGTGALGLTQASGSTAGYLSMSDYTSFASKESGLTFVGSGIFSRAGNTVTTTACTAGQIFKSNGSNYVCSADNNTTYTVDSTLALSGGNVLSLPGTGTAGTYGSPLSVPVITTDAQGRVSGVTNTSIQTATTSQAGVLSAADFATFNGKQAALAFGNLTSPTAAVSITGGSGAVIGAAGASFTIATATGSQNGLVSAVDWTTFNNKENALTFSGNGMFSRTGNTVSATSSCTTGQALVYNGASWACSSPTTGTVTGVAGTGAITSTGGSAPVVGLTTTSDFTQSGSALGLSASGATAGTYGSSTTSATAIPVVTVDAKGRITSISSSTIANASASATGLLSSTDYATFTAKQSALPVGTVTQYLRGNQTLATLDTSVVAENGNLYYTDARARAALSASGPLAYNAVTGAFSIAQATGSIAGYLSAADYTTFNAKESGLTFTGNGIFSRAGNTISSTVCANNQIFKSNGSTYSCAADNDTTYTASTGLTLAGTVLSMTATGTAGTYGSSVSVPVITTNAQGQVTSVTSTAIPVASASTTGLLTAADYNTFNGKQSAITAGTGLSLAGSTLSVASNNGGVTDHNTLANLQGGAAGEEYHLNQANYNALNLSANGQLRNVAGTASAPAYSFTGDTGTGLFNPSANKMCFATGGTSQWCIDSAGNWMPGSDAGQNIGSATNRVKDIYLSGTTLYFNTDTLKNISSALTWSGTGGFVTPNGNVGIKSGATASNPLTINTATTADATAQALIATGGVSKKGLVIQATAGQTANLLEGQDSTGIIMAYLSATGAFNLQNSSNSTTAFNVKNAAGTNVATVDSTNSALKIQSSSATAATVYILNSDGTSAIEIRAGGTGQSNTLVGVNTGQSITTGSNNTSLGYNSLRANGTGSNNTALGLSALRANSSGSNNTASGVSALTNNTTASNNTAFGHSALSANTTGANNMASGQSALSSNTIGANNSAFGQSALRFNTTGSNNTASGQGSLFTNTFGSNNTASGLNAMMSNTTGLSNTATGVSTLYSNTIGSNNIASGQNALYNNTTGSNNAASGFGSLSSNTSGTGNDASGYNALQYNSTGNNNTAQGFNAYGNFVNNTAGNLTVTSVTTGAQGINLFNVPGHGYTIANDVCFRVSSTGTIPTPITAGFPVCFSTIDANNFSYRGTITAIGSGTITLTPNFQYDNSTAIGANSTITASNQVVIGDANVTLLQTAAGINQTNAANANTLAGNLGIGVAPAFALDVLTTGANGTQVARFRNAGATSCNVIPGGTSFACSSDERLKTNISSINSGLDIVKQLRGVTFNWNGLASGDGTVSGLRYGFIAQEVEKVLPNAVSTGVDGYKMLNTEAITPYLVSGLQELNAKVDNIDASALAALAKADAVSIKGNLTIGGDLYVNGKLKVGEDTSGTAVISKGKKTVHVAFKTAYPNSLPPKVTATPHTISSANFAINDVTATGFDIVIEAPSAITIEYDWIALAGGRSDSDVSAQ